MKTLCPPANIFFDCISRSFTLLKQNESAGKFTYFHEFFMTLEVCWHFNRVKRDDVWQHIVILRSAWIPEPFRGCGVFLSSMELLLEYAKGSGVAIMAVANPFELSNHGKTAEDFERIFIEEIGFRLIADYEDKKLRQRRRLERLGFRSMRFDNVGDRDRIKKKDCFLFVPETFDPDIRRQVFDKA